MSDPSIQEPEKTPPIGTDIDSSSNESNCNDHTVIHSDSTVNMSPTNASPTKPSKRILLMTKSNLSTSIKFFMGKDRAKQIIKEKNMNVQVWVLLQVIFHTKLHYICICQHKLKN